MIGGWTLCKDYRDAPVASKAGLGSLLAGDLVLLAGEGGHPAIPHVLNGIWQVAIGAWTQLTWDPVEVPRPHIDVGAPVAADGGAKHAGRYHLRRVAGKTLAERT